MGSAKPETIAAWRAKHQNKVREYRKRWLEKNRSKQLAMVAAWKIRHNYKKEYSSDQYKKWRQEHLEHARELGREAYARNPHAANLRGSVRRARIAGNGFEKYSRAEVVKRDRSICHLCGLFVPPKELSLDHLTPIAKGGRDVFENVAVAHLICNKRKGAKKINGILLTNDFLNVISVSV